MFSAEAFKAWIETDGTVPFDLYAQNSSDWDWLAEIIPGLVVSSAGGRFPFQAEGLLHGMPFYYREEWGYASVNVGEENGEPPYLGEHALYSASGSYPNEGTDIWFPQMMIKLVPELKKSEYLWRFRSRKIHFLNDNSWGYAMGEKTAEVVGWGHTPAEGYANAQQPKPYLEEHGFSAELQMKLWADQDVDLEPFNTDTRVYPNKTPDFSVRL